MLAPDLPFARNLWKSSTVLFGLVAVALSPLAALAQETTEKATRLEKLTVTGGAAETIAEDNDTVVPTRNISALKTDTPLVETPRAVSVVTRKELEERGVQDMIQATRYTAGVTTGAFGYDPRFDQIYIRGISTTTDSDFRDGLRQPYMNYGTFTTELYTLDRIEILKGPVSVMYGGASAAGIVNRISKMPLEETHREVELQYGTIGRAQAAFDFGGPAGDGMFYRVVGLARDAETNYDIADDRYLLQPSFTWKPDEATSLTIYGLAQKGETDASPRMFEHDGELLRYSDPDYDHQKVTQYQVGYQFSHEFDNGLTFRQNARASDLDLEARYIDTSSRVIPVVPGDPPRLYTTTAVTDAERAYQIDNQLEAKFDTGAVSHTLLAGLDYTLITSDFGLGFGSVAPANLSNASTPDRSDFSSRDLRQTGVYAQEQAELGNWRAVGGLRYDWVDQTETDKDAGTQNRKDDGALSGQAGLLYLFDNGIAPYVSYGTSFVPSTQKSADGTVLDPTEGEQIEVGVKYQPEGENYSLTAATYRLVESGKPQFIADGTLPLGYYYKSSGENTYKGFELEGRTELDNGISLIAAYTYSHAEITGNVNTALIGNTPSTTPRHTTSLWVNYAVAEDTQLAGLALGAGIRVTSGSFTSDENTDRNPGAAYLDASLSYDFGKRAPQLDGLSLAVSATNLADRRERVCTESYCYYGQGRTVLGSLKYEW
ncbi:TonB-dependent siderophore receptor [Pararhizobium sp. BT-229]|uniref:TonB-dependent siderophore receptor n=1 Tax=Pararhizobium sp. BT-229 TaxID=2986923 RepID=UPI0021F7FAD0|nr:TonB-dependent siderophore receptor [Pararhizobium sp. BT-229]MCV9966136.1 TonB-dependent siderophore receptor [Pararhizobium sp. BT-229]